MSEDLRKWYRRAVPVAAIAALSVSVVAITQDVVENWRFLDYNEGLWAAAIGATLALFISLASNSITTLLTSLSSPRVFILYSHEQSDRTKAICTALGNAGAKVWIDTENIQPGQSITQAVEDALSSADVVVALFGAQPTESTIRELEFAQARGKLILPLVTESTHLPASLRDIKYLDISGDPDTFLPQLTAAVMHSKRARPERVSSPDHRH